MIDEPRKTGASSKTIAGAIAGATELTEAVLLATIEKRMYATNPLERAAIRCRYGTGPVINFHEGPVPIKGMAKTPLRRNNGPIALKIEILSVTPLVKKVPNANASAAAEA